MSLKTWYPSSGGSGSRLKTARFRLTSAVYANSRTNGTSHRTAISPPKSSAAVPEITDQTVGVAASYAITDYLSVSAQVNYTWIPSHELRKADYMGCGKDQLVWGGVNMTLSF